MSPGITKTWLVATPEALAEVPVTTGVYEVAVDDETVDIGYAGSHEPFGLRSAIARVVAELGGEAVSFRHEQHVQYHSRYVEIVLSHKARHGGSVPVRVQNRQIPVLGRISQG